MSERLPSHVEASGLVRRTEAAGGFAAILRRGDRDRGSLIIMVIEKGAPHSLVERRLSSDFSYRWTVVPAQNVDWPNIARDRVRIDPDCWLIELDIPVAERFVAEMIAEG